MSLVAFLHMLLDPILNASQDIRHVTLHIAVMKSQYIQAETFQILLPDLIPCKLLSMAFTIDLDHELQLRAIEIHDVFVNRSLSQEGVPAFCFLSIASRAVLQPGCCGS
jgi:hypothetical protein